MSLLEKVGVRAAGTPRDPRPLVPGGGLRRGEPVARGVDAAGEEDEGGAAAARGDGDRDGRGRRRAGPGPGEEQRAG